MGGKELNYASGGARVRAREWPLDAEKTFFQCIYV